MEVIMTKQVKPKAKQPGGAPAVKLAYHCRCYKVGDEYEMWVLDPKTDTYSGPIPCTKEQCRKCNMSEAEIV